MTYIDINHLVMINALLIALDVTTYTYCLI